MNELFSFLVGFYLFFNRRWLWGKFMQATNEGRIMFGVAVYLSSLLYWWFS